MKGILVILDGLGDLPHKLLNDMTPLEAAQTPNMDFLAARGELGFMYSVKPSFIPESDEAIVSIFGNDLISSSRGQLEARGSGLKVMRGDLAFRVNFATIDSLDQGNIIDRRAGRTLTTEEANLLAKAVNKIKLPCEFIFKPTIQHRAALVFRGGFSDDISGNDSTYTQGMNFPSNKISKCKTLEDDENAQYTVNIVNEFLEKAYGVLSNHPINIGREKRGLLPANFLLIRGAGIEPPKLKQYKKWVSSNYMPLEIGFSNACGIKNYSFEYPKLEGIDAYENLWKGLRKACKHAANIIKKNLKRAEYAYIHIKEIDLPGHDNKPVEKKLMLEYIDITLIRYLRSVVPENKIKVVITGDHSTPCKLKGHSADPVPVLFYPAKDVVPSAKKFCEKECRRGQLGRINGNELLQKVGFVK
jgi:2,3-bisphosphoglycerate-independent phosphoglycerate mutase